MTAMEALATARALLLDETPLAQDCGLLCGAACCRSESGAEGMLLFPGEAALYAGSAWASLRPAAEGQTLLTCRGRCPREERPLLCRFFPLTPVYAGAARAVMERGAVPVCPLYASGKRGLNQTFVAAAREAAQALSQSEEQRAFLGLLHARQKEYRFL